MTGPSYGGIIRWKWNNLGGQKASAARVRKIYDQACLWCKLQKEKSTLSWYWYVVNIFVSSYDLIQILVKRTFYRNKCKFSDHQIKIVELVIINILLLLKCRHLWFQSEPKRNGNVVRSEFTMTFIFKNLSEKLHFVKKSLRAREKL